jgi:hypothetical protein
MFKELVIRNVINIMLSNLSPAIIRAFLLSTIRTIEKGILDSDSKIDDSLGLPLIQMLKEVIQEEKPKLPLTKSQDKEIYKPTRGPKK